MKSSASKIKLNSYDDLFGKEQKEPTSAQVVEIPLEQMIEFKDHPFRVVEDEAMEELIESIKENGVLVPGIVRKTQDNRYEILAGHRRRFASERAGKRTMPVFVKELDDDESTLVMVDSNLQREDILPSEKARAYRMKYEAMKHQGARGAGSTLDALGEGARESAKTVQRYIYLARLIDGLMELVDSKKIGMTQGVDLSFLNEDAQKTVHEVMQILECGISMEQSAKLKMLASERKLTIDDVKEILRPKEKSIDRKLTIKSKDIKEYFDDTYSKEDIEKVIFELLAQWKERNGGH